MCAAGSAAWRLGQRLGRVAQEVEKGQAEEPPVGPDDVRRMREHRRHLYPGTVRIGAEGRDGFIDDFPDRHRFGVPWWHLTIRAPG